MSRVFYVTAVNDEDASRKVMALSYGAKQHGETNPDTLLRFRQCGHSVWRGIYARAYPDNIVSVRRLVQFADCVEFQLP